MNLHRTSGVPDWELVAPNARNGFQAIAAATRGIITPANVITSIGLMLVCAGLVALMNQLYWEGLGLLVIGRLLDVVDGIVAEATLTKSPLGEIFDAVADKVGTLLTIIVLFAAAISYWWVLVALLVPQAIIPLFILYKKQKGITVHPTRIGKLSMAAAWVGIAGLLLAKALGDVTLVSVIVYVVIGTSLVLGMYALWQYGTGRD